MRVHDARSRAGDFTLHEHSFQLVRAPACSVGLDLYDAHVAVRDFYPALEVPGVTVSPTTPAAMWFRPFFSLQCRRGPKATKAQATSVVERYALHRAPLAGRPGLCRAPPRHRAGGCMTTTHF